MMTVSPPVGAKADRIAARVATLRSLSGQSRLKENRALQIGRRVLRANAKEITVIRSKRKVRLRLQ